MVGQRVRRLRRERGLTQARMAERLGISTSYLNLIERGQRPVTVPFLLKLGRVFDLDLQRFAEDDEGRVVARLKEVFADPLFARGRVADQDIRDVAAASPTLGDAVFTLFRAYRDLAEERENPDEGLTGERPPRLTATAGGPEEAVRDALQAKACYFPELEDAAAQLRAEADTNHAGLAERIQGILEERCSVKIRIMPSDVMHGVLRRYDRHGRRVLLSELLPAEARAFQLAHQAALIGWRDPLDGIAERSGLEGDARRLLVMRLADYFAGACLMPYEPFLEAAETLRYDMDLLSRRFGVEAERVCDRLITMQRPGAKGVPFFLARMDCAGNLAGHFSAAGFHFARFGGLCPRWGVHRAALTPGETRVETVEMPDGARFLTIARTVPGLNGGHELPGRLDTVIVGCPVVHATRLVYGAELDDERASRATPIGVNCRLCERTECTARAFPPFSRRAVVDENRHALSSHFLD